MKWRPTKPAVAVAALSALTLALLYVLSIGPALVMACRNPANFGTFTTTYSPILWTCHYLPPARAVAAEYGELWAGQRGRFVLEAFMDDPDLPNY